MKKLLFLFVLLVVALLTPVSVLADVTYGASTSVLLSSSMYSDVTGMHELHVKSLLDTSPPAYSESYGPESVVETNDLFSVGAELASGFISSDVDGSLGGKSVEGDLQTSFISFSMLDILSVTASSMDSNALINGDIGSINKTGFVSFSGDLVLTVLGSTVDTSAPGEVYNQGGLKILMAEFGNIDEPFAFGISATAFVFDFDNFAHDGDVFNGTVYLGQTSAYMQAVPEPASMLVLGGLGLAVALRRRKK